MPKGRTVGARQLAPLLHPNFNEIRQKHSLGMCISELARMYSLSHHKIRKIIGFVVPENQVSAVSSN